MLSTWRRRILLAVIIVLTVVGIPIGLEFHARSQARSDLEKIIAELDQNDPRWRLEDIEADRQQVPEDKNSASTIVAAYRLFPKNWGPTAPVELDKVPPPISLRKEQAEKLANFLKPMEPGLAIARKLKDQPIGHFKIDYAPDFLSTLMPGDERARSISCMLELDVILFLHRNELEKAWNSNRALLNAGRSLGDEPFLLSMLIRMVLEEMAIHSLERAIAQGAFPLPHLDERQKEFEKEMTVAFFLIGIRGERGGADYLLNNIEAGKINLKPWVENVAAIEKEKREENLWDPIQNFFSFSTVIRSHATLLHLDTKLVEAAKLLPSERAKVLKKAEESYLATVSQNRNSNYLTMMLYPAVQKISQREQRLHAKIACAVAALGAERFRLQKNRWPESLAEMVQASCLKKIPVDLFDGKPLRFRRTKDGLAIYSIGPEGNYDGKALDDLRNINEAVVRVEFRLWDPAHRRQPPLPLPKPEK